MKILLEDTESIIGTLNHVCLMVPHGRTRMPTLYRFRSSFKTKEMYIKHTVSHSLQEDMAWWKETLAQDFVGVKIKMPTEPLNTILMVDASMSWGIGLILDDRWLAWELLPGWKTEGREIGWAEMVAIDLTIQTLIAKGLRNCHLIIRSDNQGVVGALKAGYSRGQAQNQILHHIIGLMQEFNIWITTTWISTKENLTDEPSRGIFRPRNRLLQYVPKILDYLKQYVERSIDFHDPRLK